MDWIIKMLSLEKRVPWLKNRLMLWRIILKYVFSFVVLVFGMLQFYRVLFNQSELTFTNSLTQTDFFILFLIFLFLGIKALYRAIAFKKNMLKTVGRIIGFEENRDFDNVLKFKSVIKYEDIMGNSHSFCSSKMFDNKPVIGDEVVYDKYLSDRAEVNSFFCCGVCQSFFWLSQSLV